MRCKCSPDQTSASVLLANWVSFPLGSFFAEIPTNLLNRKYEQIQRRKS
ncbi:unnamed protein product [Tetraodon nigroviridis]|uniref:(spotted green pufferfish) hypothetical protein n=1 Tax=Tetraodon nigroviridis TaxID=99883 RepID=Q4S5H5_TETNG|nr:unnamed protein product [Tetraodon nigroviridis]